MEIIQKNVVIKAWREWKQRNEQELAENLYDVFNSVAPLTNLRTVVALALKEVINPDPASAAGNTVGLNIAARDTAVRSTVVQWAAVDQESFLAVWKRHGNTGPNVASLWNITHDLNTPARAVLYTAADCADLIRFIGCWVEHLGKDHALFQIKSAFRVGVKRGEKPRHGPAGFALALAEAERQAVWRGKCLHTYHGVHSPAPRDRGRLGGALVGIEAHIRSSWGGAAGNLVTGMRLKRAWNHDNTLKIDNIFGLLPGGSISGTTADTMFAVEKWGIGILNQTYYLLPAATIVYYCHHTLLEVALALSLNKAINYRIGFYTTLLPAGNVPQVLQEIVEHLQKAEGHENNRHFVIWYENNNPDQPRLLLFDKAVEQNALRRMDMSLATVMLKQSQGLPTYPNKSQIIELIRMEAPEIYRMLSFERLMLRG